MKKLICLMAVVMVLFTACGGNNANDNAEDAKDGVVQDGDGVIDENNDDDNDVVDNVADGTEELVDGAADATDEAVDGTKRALDDMTGMNRNNNSKNSTK